MKTIMKCFLLLVMIILLTGCFSREERLSSLYHNKQDGIIEDYSLVHIRFEGAWEHAHKYALIKQDGIWYLERFTALYGSHDPDLGSRVMSLDFMGDE